MSRWNNNLEQNCNEVIENIIKNISPAIRQDLVLTVLNANLTNTKKEIERFIRDTLGITKSFSKHSKGYWLSRGWDDNNSYVKSKEHKQLNCKSVYSQQTWLEKINPVTNTYYTAEDADFERNSRRPIRKEYWIKKGHTEEDAIQLATSTKDNNNKKGSIAAGTSTIRNVSSKRCIDYYIARGYSLAESQIMITNSQKYFSKDICIEKYGNVDGIAVWQNRQASWQATLNKKSDEEKARINRLKLSKGITVSAAEKLILEQIQVTIPNVIHQFTLIKTDKKQYVYDIMANNKIIEYNGDFWHANPNIYLPDYVNPRTKLKAVDKWALDSIKIRYAQSQGYEVLVIWERDFKNNTEETIKKCIQFLIQ